MDAAWTSTITAATAVSQPTLEVEINGITLAALVDSGSTDSFIREDLVKQLGLKVRPSKVHVYMASSVLSAMTMGFCVATIRIGKSSYSGVRLSILSNLCMEVILGQKFMNLHSEIIFIDSGDRPALKVCRVAEAALNPPTLFGGVPADCKPIATKSRRFSWADKNFIASETTRLLQEGIIECSSSAWRAQVLVIEPANHKKRLVIDYSQTINKHTPLDAYLLPKIQELVESVAKYRVFSTLDLKSAYHQIPLLLSERDKTAFEANGEFCRLPFGLTNVVASFQRIMNDFIRDNELAGTFAYLDNLLVCGVDQQDHDRNFQCFSDVAQKYNFAFNNNKCFYKQTSIDFLGFTILDGIIRPDAECLCPLREYPLPVDSDSLHHAVSLLSYYSQWISKFSDRIRPLASSTSFPLGQEVEIAFRGLKAEIEAAVLWTIDEGEPLVIETDASDFCLAATLNQSGRPVDFFS